MGHRSFLDCDRFGEHGPYEVINGIVMAPDRQKALKDRTPSPFEVVYGVGVFRAFFIAQSLPQSVEQDLQIGFCRRYEEEARTEELADRIIDPFYVFDLNDVQEAHKHQARFLVDRVAELSVRTEARLNESDLGAMPVWLQGGIAYTASGGTLLHLAATKELIS